MATVDRILPSMRLDGRLALVTGAGRGIGRGCALALAEAGAEVVAVSRTAGDLQSLAEDAARAGGKLQALPCDVTDRAALGRAFAGLGRLDVLVNNAGVAAPGPFLEADEAAIDSVLTVNVRAATLVAQAGARLMAAQGGGVIVNLSSTYGKVGRPGNAVYAASKHYVEGLTKSLAVELAPMRIRVVAVGPTAVDTPMTHDRLVDPKYGAEMLARIPLGRFCEVRDVAAAVVFLASPAAGLITGTTLMIDGGWTAQ